MATQLATFWGLVINNPTETDYALVHQGYPDYLRALIHTTETGADGTSHIQGWIKLQKQQRMSFVKKLFPRANLQPLQKDEYELNTRRYVQKNDETTAGAHIQTFNDPIPDPVRLIEIICTAYISDVIHSESATTNTNRESFRVREALDNEQLLKKFIRTEEKRMVRNKPSVAKLFVSPMYSKLKREYLQEIFSHTLDKYNDDSSNTEGRDEVHSTNGEEVQEAIIEETESGGDESQSDHDSEGGSTEFSEEDERD